VKRIVAFLLAVAGALTACSAAFANSLTDGHSAQNSPGQFQPPGGANAAGTTHVSGAGTLPFTGLNLATVAVVAVLLIACGLVLRRMTRHQQ
jgi:CBS-domain-containing membrane protein